MLTVYLTDFTENFNWEWEVYRKLSIFIAFIRKMVYIYNFDRYYNEYI